MDVPRHAPRAPRAALVLGLVAILVGACSGGGATPSGGSGSSTGATASTGAPSAWSGAPDLTKAQAEGATLVTYGMPDDWANYGQVIKAFCAKYQITGCVHNDTDMTSAQEIQRYDAEKNNPVAIFSDIGLAYGPLAEAKGVVPDYLPPSADQLPASLKPAAGQGGWVPTFAGVPAILVNTDALAAKSLPVPNDWTDLANPAYKGLIGVRTPGSAGEGDAFFMALVSSTGGSWGNFASGIALAKKIAPNLNGQAGNEALIESGQIPILIKYDFNAIAIADTLQGKGIHAKVIIPPSGSIYAPSAMMVNGYNTSQTDIAKLYMDYVLSSDAQTLFAKFGARPILYVLGKLQLSGDATSGWLPQSDYTNVKQIDFTQVDPTQIGTIWTDQVTAG